MGIYHWPVLYRCNCDRVFKYDIRLFIFRLGYGRLALKSVRLSITPGFCPVFFALLIVLCGTSRLGLQGTSRLGLQGNSRLGLQGTSRLGLQGTSRLGLQGKKGVFLYRWLDCLGLLVLSAGFLCWGFC